MPFTGTYEHTIDSKNRLSIPAALRSAMDPEYDGDKLYLAPIGRTTVLSLLGNIRFNRLASQRRGDRIPVENELAFDRLFYANSYLLEFDTQGRVLIPDLFIRRAEIGRDVTILGVNDHVEIWNRSVYGDFLKEQWTRFEEIQQQARQDDGRHRD